MSVELETEVTAYITVDCICDVCGKKLESKLYGRDDIKVTPCENCKSAEPVMGKQSFCDFLTESAKRGIFSLEYPTKDSLIRFIEDQYLLFKSL